MAPPEARRDRDRNVPGSREPARARPGPAEQAARRLTGETPRRARELGIVVGSLAPGPLNAITDVAGVRVGHTTLVEGESIRTGVTVVVPDQLDDRVALAAGLFVGNGHGKMVGTTQVAELGEIETPVLLTATLSTFRVADALLTYMLGRPGRESALSLNPVVAETNDGYLSDIRARPISAGHVLTAIAFTTAAPGLPAAPERDLEPAFPAVLEAVEEALLNSLFMAETTRGFEGHVKYAVPHRPMLGRLGR